MATTSMAMATMAIIILLIHQWSHGNSCNSWTHDE